MQDDMCEFCALVDGYVKEIQASRDIKELTEIVNGMIHEVKAKAQLELVQDSISDLVDARTVLLEDLGIQ